MEIISSRSNPKIKQVRALRQRKARQEGEFFLIEGIRPVGEAIEAGLKLETVYYAPELLRSPYALSLIERLHSEGQATCLAVSAEIFGLIAEKDNPVGLLAVAHQPQLQLSDFNRENFRWGVALVDPQDPGNTGTIMRTIDAVGASGLLLLSGSESRSGLVDPYHPGSVRASMGTLFWHPPVCATFSEFSTWAASNQYHIYGTSSQAAVDIDQVARFQLPAILLMGSEREGLSAEQRQNCEMLIRLPMHGRATSLNLAVATGVMLYEMLRKKASA